MLEAMTIDADAAFQAQTFNEALERAGVAGRGAVADYILLKESNDRLRTAAVRWLLDAWFAVASEANKRDGVSIAVETSDAHRFAVGNSNLVGSRLALRQTVRCLTLEAGWTRAPADGFMSGGALALGRITHFGIKSANADLLLARSADNSIDWFAVGTNGERILFDAGDIQRHFQIFLGEEF